MTEIKVVLNIGLPMKVYGGVAAKLHAFLIMALKESLIKAFLTYMQI
jgi:hypothetical protein